MAKIYSVAFAVTPSNSVNLPQVVTGIYVGVTGDVSVCLSDDTIAAFVGVPAGAILPVQAKRVMASGTSATSILGLA